MNILTDGLVHEQTLFRSIRPSTKSLAGLGNPIPPSSHHIAHVLHEITPVIAVVVSVITEVGLIVLYPLIRFL